MSQASASKVQSSLHSFFKRKASPSPPAAVVVDDDGVIDLSNSPPPKKAKLQDNDPSTSIKGSLTQSSSSYFKPKLTKPPSNGASSNPTPSVVLQEYRLARPPRTAASQSGSAFENYTLGSGPSDARSSSSSELTAEQRKRRAAWQRLALGPGGVLPRRRSLTLDEAAAKEARRAAGDIGDGEDDDVETPAEDEEREAEKQEVSSVGNKLRAKYAAAEVKPTKSKGKKKEEVGPSGLTYSPLEKQFLEVKAKWPDVLLFMEVGYKYKFHGDDAKTASKELGIAAFPSRNFYVGSIPTHRLHIHVKKLISLGYKVGVVSQMETAALKKIGDNRNAPFVRELTHLYTAATYVDDPFMSSSNAVDTEVLPGAAPSPINALVVVVELGMGGMATDERVRIGLVSVTPGTGEVIWDQFDDSQVRTELETRLTHLQPSELLLPASGLSNPTEKVIKHYSGSLRATIRVERIKELPKYDKAFDILTEFYKSSKPDSAMPIDLTEDEENGKEAEQPVDANDDPRDPVEVASGLPTEDAILALVDFPKQVVIAFAVAITYMKDFGLQNAFRHRSSFTKFVNRAHMLLSSNTLDNLEVYRNQTDGGVHGSLLWLLDHTRTRMGRRLMREWIGRPLLDIAALRARTDAIEEIMESGKYQVEKLRGLLVNMPDLVKGLTRVQYGKVLPTELATILVALVRVASEFKPTNDEGPFDSALLNNIIKTLPTIGEKSREFLAAVNLKEARTNNEADMWNDIDKYPEIQDAKDCIIASEFELNEHLKEVRKVVKRPALNYITVSGIEYLVELPNREVKSVPPKWVKISSTKSVTRFHTPEIISIMKEREQSKETLKGAARRAFLSFQSDIAECHEFVVVSRQLAVIDCLLSLAQVAAASGYCKPSFVTQPQLKIENGRHPMVEALRDEAYVPFDIDFSEDDGRAKIITGPNMAGKSSCVRATALIVCMAQIGSFVPASSVTLGIHDAVQTRMGASDEISRGKSTFMVELSETSDILRTVTPRTLVILDELGRGTSTYDGVAIAYATLSHLAKLGCNTLFVTHYPMVAEQLVREYPEQVSNWHMSFDEVTLADGSAEITFLYKLTRGLAEASFGVWCARLAGLPAPLLVRAQAQSDLLKIETQHRLIASIAKRSRVLLRDTGVTQVGGDEGAGVGTRSEIDVVRNVEILHQVLRMVSSV